MTTRMFLECLRYLVPLMLTATTIGFFQDSSAAWVLVPLYLAITLGLFIWWVFGPIEATMYCAVIVGWFILDFLPSLTHPHRRNMIAAHNLRDWVLA